MFKLSFQRQVFLGLLLALLIVFGINFFSWIGLDEYKKNEALITHTQEVISNSNEVLIGVLNAETGQRGYLLTGKESYLDPYQQAISSVKGSLDKLSKLVTDNPEQVTRVDSVNGLVNRRLESLAHALQLKHDKGEAVALEYILTDKGKILSQQIREKVKEIILEEKRLLQIREDAAAQTGYEASRNIIIGASLVFLVLGLMLRFILRTFKMQKEAESRVKESNSRLQQLSGENARQNWLLVGNDRLNEQLRGEKSIEELGANIIESLCTYLHAQVGALYLYHDQSETLVPAGGYAFSGQQAERIKLGEGLLGQAAREQSTLLLEKIPENYLKVQSTLGNAVPHHIIISSFALGKRLKAVVEMGFTGEKEQRRLELLDMVGENVAIAIDVAQARENMRKLLEQVQRQSEELETQQEELRQTNEELSRQTQLLQASEEELRVQQEELRQTNAELEEKAALLEEKNQAVEEAREAIVTKASELELTNRYKSEFLANMSHELRTPLNSILILAELLGANKKKHLDEEEVKYAKVVFNAGSDLLTLINDILDLSKIESGKLELNWEQTHLKEISANMKQLFEEVAARKKIEFEVSIDSNLPAQMETDQQRLEQIIRNLLSNAFKFTPEGGKVSLRLSSLNESTMALSVKDTGIGIAADKLDVIFEAFKQADGSTNRQYGGTGLGLSISKELAHLLGGRIELESKEDEGSTFRLIIPLKQDTAAMAALPAETHELPMVSRKTDATLAPAQDDRGFLADEDKTILIVEDDLSFANILMDYAHKRGFKALVAHNGLAALEMARSFLPHAIILDIMLPLMDGWEVLRELKSDEQLRSIPVHIMSATDSNGVAFRKSGAISFNQKPLEQDVLENIFTGLEWALNPRHNKVLLVEDQLLQSNLMREALVEQGFLVHQAFDGKEALRLLEENSYDCLILDLNLPDSRGLELLTSIKENEKHHDVPVIINTASDLSAEMHEAIRKYSNALVMKSKRSNERLLDEVRLFMNKVKTEKPLIVEGKKSRSTTMEKTLKGKKILLVDDDMRNIFALSSALQDYELKVEIAGNGIEALEKLKEARDFDLVLMDIMMPLMDGYEAMKRIREDQHYSSVPIIALTAKAMKNDREKCLEAGASDYIPKPVNMEKLLSMMRVWLSR